MTDALLILTFTGIVLLLLVLASKPLDNEIPSRQIHARKFFNRKVH